MRKIKLRECISQYFPEKEPRICKECAHMIMDAEKSQDLLSGRWAQESLWLISSLNAGRLKTQEEPMFQFKSDGQKKPNVSA